MIYRIITVWRDEEEKEAPVMRAALDFPSAHDAETHIASAAAAGVIRIDLNNEPLENGARMLALAIPLARIVGWFIWELPDDAPSWPIQEPPNAPPA